MKKFLELEKLIALKTNKYYKIKKNTGKNGLIPLMFKTCPMSVNNLHTVFKLSTKEIVSNFIN